MKKMILLLAALGLAACSNGADTTDYAVAGWLKARGYKNPVVEQVYGRYHANSPRWPTGGCIDKQEGTYVFIADNGRGLVCVNYTESYGFRPLIESQDKTNG